MWSYLVTKWCPSIALASFCLTTACKQSVTSASKEDLSMSAKGQSAEQAGAAAGRVDCNAPLNFVAEELSTGYSGGISSTEAKYLTPASIQQFKACRRTVCSAGGYVYDANGYQVYREYFASSDRAVNDFNEEVWKVIPQGWPDPANVRALALNSCANDQQFSRRNLENIPWYKPKGWSPKELSPCKGVKAGAYWSSEVYSQTESENSSCISVALLPANHRTPANIPHLYEVNLKSGRVYIYKLIDKQIERCTANFIGSGESTKVKCDTIVPEGGFTEIEGGDG